MLDHRRRESKQSLTFPPFLMQANLLTGMVNLCVDTLSSSTVAAFSILSGYSVVLVGFVGLARFCRVKLKFWWTHLNLLQVHALIYAIQHLLTMMSWSISMVEVGLHQLLLFLFYIHPAVSGCPFQQAQLRLPRRDGIVRVQEKPYLWLGWLGQIF